MQKCKNGHEVCAAEEAIYDEGTGKEICPLCLLEVAKAMRKTQDELNKAADSLMGEVTGKSATDWGLVNATLCKAQELSNIFDKIMEGDDFPWDD